MLRVNEQIQIPLRELEIRFARSAGPGGQRVNKVSTKAVLRWDVGRSASLPTAVRERLRAQQRRRFDRAGMLMITSQRFRDQGRNVADCLEKLRQMVLAAAVKPKPRRPTRPTQASRETRLREKRIRSRRKTQRRPPGEEE